MPTIAVVQYPPVLADRDATLSRTIELARDAAKEGAKLVVFPEAFIPGYPSWIWRLRPGGDMGLSGEIHQRLVKNAVEVGSGHLDELCATAKDLGVDILCGIDEIDPKHHSVTLFNSYVHISHEGEIVNVHRKVMPTNPERMVWGFGDGRGLRVVDTPIGRVGSLICWENFMPTARMTLYAQGIDIYVAPTWDSSDGWLGTMQHIAREGRCYVVNCCTAMNGGDVPEDFPGRDQLFEDDEIINLGESCVVAPGGDIIAGPVKGEQTILYADIDLDKVHASRRSLDIAGHYHRPDIFQLEVDRSYKEAARFSDEE